MRLYLPLRLSIVRPFVSLHPLVWPRSQRSCPSFKVKPILRLYSSEAAQGDAKEADWRLLNGQKTTSSDHRKIGIEQKLWTLHPSSPGSPIFTPEGTYIFQKLQAFLRAQYPAFGFEEVVTPTIYKQALWEQSGHWENYKDDMFIVSSGKQSCNHDLAHPVFKDGKMQPLKPGTDDGEGILGLKPMNCPGHCLLYASQRRSYNDLPIRYADFSPLHRDEISGALTGLTRVRRFHQDDGHIFCRPSQIEAEIIKSLELMTTVYKALGIDDYSFVLSTRPERDFIGAKEEWEDAEHQLEAALNRSLKHFDYSAGDGAFYGPKIDAIFRDGSMKVHQIGTIQLDFQLPKRFNLTYIAPKSKEASNTDQNRVADTPIWDGNSPSTGNLERDTPVLIHRAILGSLERFMALLMEAKAGKWPFWLNPHPAVVLTVGNNPSVLEYADNAVNKLRYPETTGSYSTPKLPRSPNAVHYKVDLDNSTETLAKKVALAKQKGYAVVVIIGEKNHQSQDLDVEVSNIPDQTAVWAAIEEIKPGSRAPVKKDRGVGTKVGRKYPGVRLSVKGMQDLMQIMSDRCT